MLFSDRFLSSARLIYCPFYVCGKTNHQKLFRWKNQKGGGVNSFVRRRQIKKILAKISVTNQNQTNGRNIATLSMLLFMHPLFIHPHCQRYSSCIQCIHVANVLFIHPHCLCALHISTLPMLLFIYPHCQCYSSYIHISIVILDQSSCISLFRGFRNTESNLYWSWIMWWIF